MKHGKTYNKLPRRINQKATKGKTNTGTTALERSVEQTTGGFKALLQLANFTLGPDATLNTEIHKNSVRSKAPFITFRIPLPHDSNLYYKYNKHIRNTILNFNKLFSDLDIETPLILEIVKILFSFYQPAGQIVTGNLKIITDSCYDTVYERDGSNYFGSIKILMMFSINLNLKTFRLERLLTCLHMIFLHCILRYLIIL